MKKIEAIVRPTKVNDVLAALEAAGHCGLMISEIEGHGKQKGLVHTVRGKEYRVDMMTKIRIELVVRDELLDQIVRGIREAAFTGEIGDGKIFISTIDDVMRIRTGETGADAI